MVLVRLLARLRAAAFGLNSKAADGLDDPFGGFFCHRHGVVQHAADGRDRYAGFPGDIDDGRLFTRHGSFLQTGQFDALDKGLLGKEEGDDDGDGENHRGSH